LQIGPSETRKRTIILCRSDDCNNFLSRTCCSLVQVRSNERTKKTIVASMTLAIAMVSLTDCLWGGMTKTEKGSSSLSSSRKIRTVRIVSALPHSLSTNESISMDTSAMGSILPTRYPGPSERRLFAWLLGCFPRFYGICVPLRTALFFPMIYCFFGTTLCSNNDRTRLIQYDM